MPSENGESFERTDRRTVLKRTGAVSAGGLLGTAVLPSTVAAYQEWDPDNDGEFGHVDISWAKVDEYRGDDVYEIDLTVAWGTPYRDEHSTDHTRPGGYDTLTVYWDDNIWGFYEFVNESSYAAYADELVDPYYGTYERQDWESGTEYDIMTDDGLIHGEADGWVTEYDIPSKAYVNDDPNLPRQDPFGPVYVKYRVVFQLLHQDDSAGRVLYEVARNVTGGMGSVQLCGGVGPAAVCYDTGSGGGPKETMDSGYGWLIP